MFIPFQRYIKTVIITVFTCTVHTFALFIIIIRAKVWNDQGLENASYYWCDILNCLLKWDVRQFQRSDNNTHVSCSYELILIFALDVLEKPALRIVGVIRWIWISHAVLISLICVYSLSCSNRSAFAFHLIQSTFNINYFYDIIKKNDVKFVAYTTTS